MERPLILDLRLALLVTLLSSCGVKGMPHPPRATPLEHPTANAAPGPDAACERCGDAGVPNPFQPPP